MSNHVEPQIDDVEPEVEPEGTSELLKPGDDTYLASLEKAAGSAHRAQKAIMLLCVGHTFPEDWSIHGKGDKAKACLGSAGAERLIRSLAIRFGQMTSEKQVWTDATGEAYRYVYRCQAELAGKAVQAQGMFSSREKLLGKVGDEYRPLEEINEGHIMTAAYHVCRGEAIKALLGLRGLPARFYEDLMRQMGQKPGATPTIEYGEGTQGGSTDKDHQHRQELNSIAQEMAYGDKEHADSLVSEWAAFPGYHGKPVTCDSIKRMRGKWLNTTLDKARKNYEIFLQKMEQEGGGQ